MNVKCSVDRIEFGRLVDEGFDRFYILLFDPVGFMGRRELFRT